MSININDIKSFITVTQTKNITRAAEIMGMTQPTLSYAIKRIEEALDVELIVRLKNGVELTKAGEDFSKKATTLLNQWEDTVNIFSDNGNVLFDL